jgi:hypothetical protein
MKKNYLRKIIVGVILSTFVNSLECLDFSTTLNSSIEIIGEKKIINENASAIVKQGDYLYMAINESTHPVLIYDITNPINPRLVHYLEVSGRPIRLRIIDDKWLWTVFENGEEIYDLTDPSQPIKVSGGPNVTQLEKIKKKEEWQFEFYGKKFILHPCLSYYTFTNKNILYYGTYVDPTNGETPITEIYDINDTKDPKLLSIIEEGQPSNLVGNLLFIGCKIYDVSNPSEPKKLGEIERDNFKELKLKDIYLKNNVVYYEDGKLYIGIGIRYTSFWGFERGKQVEETQEGIAIFDANDWSNITLLGWYIPPLTQTPVNITSIVSHKDYVFAADSHFGLRVFEVKDPKNIKEIASDRQIIDLSAVAYIKNRKLLCIGEDIIGGLAFIDVSDPKNPEILSKVCVWPARISGNIGVYKDRYIYAQGEWIRPRPRFTCLFIIDTEDVRNPKMIVIPGILGKSYGMVIVDDYLYTSGGTILNLSNPEIPTTVGLLPCSGHQINYKEPYLYITNFIRGELYVVNIKDRIKPKLVGKMSLPVGHHVSSMEIIGKYLFIGWGYKSPTEVGQKYIDLLVAIDISNPSKPSLAKIWDTKKDLGFNERFTYTHVWTDGKYLFVGVYNKWLAMYEVIEKPKLSLKKVKEIGGLPNAWFMTGEAGIIYRICLGKLVILKY